MPLRLVEEWKARDAIGDWRLPGEPSFARSHAYTVLVRELRRYASEEVAGRSFLIAGHRGAGKTAMVSQAVLVLRNDILTDSADIDRAPIGRRGRLQRPLIVKLVGQNLLAPLPPKSSEKSSSGAAAQGGAESGGTAGGGAVGGEKVQEAVGSALVHLTIALYRAFAAEIAEGIGVHALKAGFGQTQAERFELAAQLALELDSAPDPAVLRSFWERMGRHEEGVLWPSLTDATLKANVVLDQGMREMVALATAAQAFRICLGDVTETEKRQNFDKQESKSEAKIDYKDLFNRLGALGAGAVAGSVVGASQTAVAGVGTGIAVWLLSGLTLSWSGSRERKRDRTVDYEFLRDRTVQTLDRDLPLVIERIRQTGLAPVFVIDELDKLDDPDRKIAEIIGRLKHLVADYGFFCFLTGRDYFDRIERKVRDEAYPSEHTYFSARLLVLNRPSDLFDYFQGIIAGDGDPTDGFRTAIFTLFVMYRSRLNFTDASRELARWCDGQNRLTCTDQELLLPARFRLAATYQMAIDHILAGEEANDRFEIDPVFAQLALDTLYYLPRRLNRNSDAWVDISAKGLSTELIARMRPPVLPSQPGAEARLPLPDPEISDPHLAELHFMLQRLIGYLLTPTILMTELMEAAAKAIGEDAASALKNRAEIVVHELGPLVARSPDDPDYIRFAVNEIGRPTAVPAAPPDPGAGGEPSAPSDGPEPPPDARPEAPAPPVKALERKRSRPARKPASPPIVDSAEPVPPEADAPPASPELPANEPVPADRMAAVLTEAKELVKALDQLLEKAGVDIEDVRAAELLPGTVTRQLLNGMVADIAAFERNATRMDAADRAHGAYLTLTSALESHGDEVAQALLILDAAWQVSRTKDRPSFVLSRISRYFDTLTRPIVPQALTLGSESVGLNGSQEIRSFEKELARQQEAYRQAFRDGVLPDIAATPEAWERWRNNLIKAAVDPLIAVEAVKPNWADIELAAANIPPGNLFRLRLVRMDRLDWSRAVLAALPGEREKAPAPAWLLFAALRALGFDQRLLATLRDAWPSWFAKIQVNDEDAIFHFINNAARAEPATLHIFRQLPPGTRLDIEPGEPILSIGNEDYINYVRALDWLVAQGAFRDVAHD